MDRSVNKTLQCRTSCNADAQVSICIIGCVIGCRICIIGCKYWLQELTCGVSGALLRNTSQNPGFRWLKAKDSPTWRTCGYALGHGKVVTGRKQDQERMFLVESLQAIKQSSFFPAFFQSVLLEVSTLKYFSLFVP